MILSKLSAAPPRTQKLLAGAVTMLGVAVVTAVDVEMGPEYGLYPLYFLPVSFAAWSLGRRGAIAAALFAAFLWLVSSYVGGLRFSGTTVWLVNFFVRFFSFAAMGILIASLRSAIQQQSQLGRIDPLTSLMNARAFHEEAERLLTLARRHEHPVTVGYIDLDGFKAVNDTFGHSAGDEVLRRAADVFRSCVRVSDLCARVGGDEFIVVLPETGPDGASAIMEKLRGKLEETLAAAQCSVTASIGAVTFIVAPAETKELVQRADALMYAAKAGGKNAVRHEVVRRASEGRLRETDKV